MHSKLIWGSWVTDMDHQPNCITCSTYASFPEYGSSNLCGYHFVNQEIVYLFFYILFSVTKCIEECAEFFVMNFITSVASKFRTKLLAVNHLIIWDRTIFDTEQKSSSFWREIMTLVSSANNIGSETEFTLRGRSLICIHYEQQRP
jgi:hypothetical protein